MRQVLSLKDQYMHQFYEEHDTTINGSTVTIIDTSEFPSQRKITLRGYDKSPLCELYIPQTMLVKIEYKKN